MWEVAAVGLAWFAGKAYAGHVEMLFAVCYSVRRGRLLSVGGIFLERAKITINHQPCR